MPSRRPPVEGRPRRFFGISLIDFAMNLGYPKSKPRGSANFRPGSNPNQMRINRMIQADSVLSTPPTNTSAIDHPMMFPPRDPTRRRFLAVAAVASAVGSGTLAAAAMVPNDVPQAVTMPIGPDPIHDVIEAHRKAAREHHEAIDIHCAFEECGMQGEKLEEYKRLTAATDAAYDRMEVVSLDLINTKPTTLAGILALCKYMEPLFGEVDQPDLPELIEYDDDTQAYIPEAFARVIGLAIEALMKAGQT
jgi:hypothetical protein